MLQVRLVGNERRDGPPVPLFGLGNNLTQKTIIWTTKRVGFVNVLLIFKLAVSVPELLLVFVPPPSAGFFIVFCQLPIKMRLTRTDKMADAKLRPINRIYQLIEYCWNTGFYFFLISALKVSLRVDSGENGRRQWMFPHGYWSRLSRDTDPADCMQ